MDLFDFNIYFDTLKKFDTGKDQYLYAVMHLVQNNDVFFASYIYTENIRVDKIDYFNKDSNDKYYINIELSKGFKDIITNVEAEIYDKKAKLDIILNGAKIDIKKPISLLPFLAQYCDIKFRVTFSDKPVDFKIRYKIYHIQESVRLDIIKNKNKVLFDGLIYCDGLITSDVYKIIK
jgi:hypothetical protein